ncbi:MAG: cytochrome D1 domain-containing protein [Thermodesulfovibrionia bacterium]|nr:cytochrome D1 domain-containing protein [Thermodesulfovibrionia bacterium]
MKKVFFVILCLVVFLAGTAMAGTVIALRGDGRVVFIDDKNEEITGKIITDGVAGALGSVTPDGKLLYVANNFLGQYTVSVIDLKQRTLIKSLPTGPRPKVPLVSPDGKWVGINHSNTEHGKMVIAIIDTSNNTVKHSVRIDISNLAYKGDISMHPIWTKDSKYFIIGNYADNTVHVIDANAGKETVKLQFDGNPHYFDITSDNKELWVLVEGEEDAAGKIVGCPKIHGYSIANLVVAAPGATPEGSFCMILKKEEVSEGHHGAFTRDGKFYYMANRGPGPDFAGTSINVFDVATKKQVAHLTAGGKGHGHPYMSADGKYVAITQYGSNVITFIDAKEHKIVKEIPVGTGKHVGFMAFTKDGEKAFVTNREEDAVYVIDMKKLEVKKKIETAEPDRKFKTQWQVLNGYYNVFETTEKYID